MQLPKPGDIVTIYQHCGDSYQNCLISIGNKYLVVEVRGDSIRINTGANIYWWISQKCITPINYASTTVKMDNSSQGGNMLQTVKDYLKDHKQILMTIAVVLVVDHLVFGGAFREKVKSLVDGLLNKAQKELDK